MLTYFQNSDSRNAVDEATRAMDSYVAKVKSLPEVEVGYMTLGDWVDGIVDDVKLEGIETLIETIQEYQGTKESAAAKIRDKYPEYAKQAEELIEKYWKES